MCINNDKMNLKLRLTILNFLEFFSWGAWLLSAGAYMVSKLHFTGVEVGAVYATMGVASIFMPPIIGTIADRWVNAEKVFSCCHLVLGLLFIILTRTSLFSEFYFIALLISMCYMPTLALNNSISYFNLESNQYDAIKTFPSIRVWGTVGFIIAAWLVDLLHFKMAEGQFYLASGASFILALYALSLPKVPINKVAQTSILDALGFEAFVLFKQKRTSIFLLFSVLLGAALQITNIWGVPFLSDFEVDYKDSFAVKHAVFLMTLSQLSEVFFILLIPKIFKIFGIKIVVMLSMSAWVLRFAFFGMGSPEGLGLLFLLLSMIIYGMAFDFYFISGSLFINSEVSTKIRSSAQGLFMMMVNGFGAVIGAYGSGFVVDYFTENNQKNWSNIWFSFAIYALAISIAFAVAFKYKHKKEVVL